jgi:hypothetical protein
LFPANRTGKNSGWAEIPKVGRAGLVLARALLGRALLGRALLGRALLGRALLGRALLGRALLGRALLGRARCPSEPPSTSFKCKRRRGGDTAPYPNMDEAPDLAGMSWFKVKDGSHHPTNR